MPVKRVVLLTCAFDPLNIKDPTTPFLSLVIWLEWFIESTETRTHTYWLMRKDLIKDTAEGNRIMYGEGTSKLLSSQGTPSHSKCLACDFFNE